MISGITKIKILIVLGVSGLLFAWLGWSWVRPTDAQDSLTVVMSGHALRVVLAVLILGLIGTAIGVWVGKPYGRQLGMLAIPAGLTVWAIQAGNMERLLMRHSEAGARVGFFYGLIGDSIIWFAVVVLGATAAWLAADKLGTTRPERGNMPAPETAGKDISTKSKGNSLANKLMENAWVRGISGLIVGGMVAIMLVKILGQARQVRLSEQPVVEASMVPTIGQIIFAVGVGFFLAGLAAHQLTEIPLPHLLAAPLLVSVVAYIYGAQDWIIESLNGGGAAFVPVSVTFATILPVQYIGVGTLAVILGYYYSVGISAHRAARRK